MWCATIEQTLCPWVTNKERHTVWGALCILLLYQTEALWFLVRTCYVDARRTTVQVLPVHLLNATTRWGGGLTDGQWGDGDGDDDGIWIGFDDDMLMVLHYW